MTGTVHGYPPATAFAILKVVRSNAASVKSWQSSCMRSFISRRAPGISLQTCLRNQRLAHKHAKAVWDLVVGRPLPIDKFEAMSSKPRP